MCISMDMTQNKKNLVILIENKFHEVFFLIEYIYLNWKVYVIRTVPFYENIL